MIYRLPVDEVVTILNSNSMKIHDSLKKARDGLIKTSTKLSDVCLQVTVYGSWRVVPANEASLVFSDNLYQSSTCVYAIDNNSDLVQTTDHLIKHLIKDIYLKLNLKKG